MSESSIFTFVFVRHSYWLISIYKMNYHTDIVNFKGCLLERGAYFEFENLTFLEGRLLENRYSLDHLRY